jgi:serine/threonine-protein kinase
MKRLRQYEMLHEIGRGGMASVYEAMHVDLGRRVAVKVMLPEVAAEARSVARFVREAKMASCVRHPHVVEIFDFGTADGVPFIVMELLEGETLGARLGRSKPLRIEEAIAVFLPIAAAVAHAHSLGVVHRDLKPANVFLTAGVGGLPWPKVLDFGISKRTDSAMHASWREGITSAESVVGTLAYMAPEQIRESRSATEQSDQYALAVILHECIVGRLPFLGTSPYELMHNILNASLRAPSSFNPALSKELDEIMSRALQRDPSKRFPSVYAFASQLLGFADRATSAVWKSALTGGNAAGGKTLDGSVESGSGLVAPLLAGAHASTSRTSQGSRVRWYWAQGTAMGVGAAFLMFAVIGSGRSSRSPSQVPRDHPSEDGGPSSGASIESGARRAPILVDAGAPSALTAAPAMNELPLTANTLPPAGTKGREKREPATAATAPKEPLPVSSAQKPAAPKTKRTLDGTNEAPILE